MRKECQLHTPSQCWEKTECTNTYLFHNLIKQCYWNLSAHGLLAAYSIKEWFVLPYINGKPKAMIADYIIDPNLAKASEWICMCDIAWLQSDIDHPSSAFIPWWLAMQHSLSLQHITYDIAMTRVKVHNREEVNRQEYGSINKTSILPTMKI